MEMRTAGVDRAPRPCIPTGEHVLESRAGAGSP